MQYIFQEISNLYSLCKEKIFFGHTHSLCSLWFLLLFTHTHCALWYARLSSLCIIEQNPPQVLLDLCIFTKIYIYIYINKTQTFFVSLIVLPTKQKFIFFSWFQVQFYYFSLHPIGEDPWAKVIKFFIAQSIYNTSISIPWWTRTTILLWKGIGFSFTQKIFFFHVKRYPKITKLISSSLTRKSN